MMPMRSVARPSEQPVPRRALVVSVLALAVPVAVVFWFPDWTSTGLGMLIWLTALIPAFLLAYYRGFAGVAVALAGGMAVITATQVGIVVFQIAEPNWTLLIAIVAIYLAISLGIAGLSEMLLRERRAAEEMALVDSLTRLPNRRHLEAVIEREFAAAERGHKLCVVLFDLDHFKKVNDRHGHAAGDEALKAFATILQTNTRKENLAARSGGEEFIAVLREEGADTAVIFAQRVLDKMREFQLPWGHETVSAGVAEYQKGMGSYELLLGAADLALYQAKANGRDGVSVAPTYDEGHYSTPPDLQAAAGVRPAALTEVVTKVYVVDDNAGVRSVIKRLLAVENCDLWDTGNPIEALQRFRESSPDERPELIISDVIMPEMSGFRMIDEMTQIKPDIRVIYMSGFVQSRISMPGTPGAVVAFLEKPFTREVLLSSFRQVTGAAGSLTPGMST
jgi:diguanylate cyclase (GGDEF)-like protein